MERLSPEWFSHVEKTGRWQEPVYWRTEKYVQSAPYTVEELDAAFDWLARVYDEKRTKRAFKDRSSLFCQLICSQSYPRGNELVSLGLDLALVDPSQSFVKSLRNPNGYHGAAFELECMAAFKVAGMEYEYEPFRRQGGKNPDFLLPRIGGGLVVDAKFARRSPYSIQAEELARKITQQDAPPFALAGRELTIEFSNALQRLLASPGGMRKLRPRAAALAAQVKEAVRAADEVDERTVIDIDGLVTIRLGRRLADSGLVGTFSMAATDPEVEIDRQIKNNVMKGAAQIPEGRTGAVLLDIGEHTDPDVAHHSVSEWLNHPDEEGGQYAGMLGVVIVFAARLAGVPVRLLHAEPVWKQGVAQEIQDWKLWARFELGLNWKRIREWARLDECVARSHRSDTSSK